MREPRYPLPRVVMDNERRRCSRRALRSRGDGSKLSRSISLAHSAPGFVVRPPERGAGAPALTTSGDREARAIAAPREARAIAAPRGVKRVRGSFCSAGFDNDPSAGSPTETLLRLLLPLNDKVQWTSRDVAGSEPPASPRSEHFTGPFNR